MSIKSFLFGLDRRQAATAAHTRPTIADSFISGTGFYAPRQADAYRNLFSHIDSLAQSFAALTPYAIDSQGNKLEPIPAPLAAWLDPNPDNSGRQWARNIAASTLYNPYTDILAITSDAAGNYDPTAPATPDNITGYVQLPPDARRYTGNGSFTCSVRLNIDGQAIQFQADRSHILTFTYSQHPERPASGISPAMTVKKWATVDDYVADYESGFFANDAVPAGIIGIVSQDAQDYENSKRRLEAARGAGNNNRVIYAPIFVDPATGQETRTAKVTWTPFQTANSTIDVKTLSDVVSQRLSSTFGVPDIVRGIDHGQTHANSQQAYRNFITFTLRPFAVNIYDQYVHELQRITGGALDWTVSFDLQEPADTDQQKTAAEANQLNTQAFAQLIQLGASPAQAAAALGLSDEWAQLDAQPTATAITGGTETQSTTASANYSARQPLSITRRQAQTAARFICRNAFKTLLEQTKAAHFAANKQDDNTAALAAATAAALLQAYEKLITQAAAQVGDTLYTQLREAARNNPAIAALLASTPNVYNDAAARAQWLQHLEADCSASFEDAQARISQMLQDNDGDDSQARQYLNHTRTPLLADNETHLSERNGQALAAAAIAAHYANVAQVVKTWQTKGDDDVCEECQAMEGTTIPAAASFGANCEYDGQPSCHPNCRCVAVYSLKIE